VIDNGNVTSGDAARRADLAAILNTAPASLRETRATMTASRRRSTWSTRWPTGCAGRREARRRAQRTQVALNAAVPLLRDLRPTLRDLKPAVATSRRRPGPARPPSRRSPRP